MAIRVPPDELVTSLTIWLTIIGQRRPALIRDLWTRKGEEYDGAKIDTARRELAKELAARLATAGWNVMREETAHDAIWRAANVDSGAATG